MMHRYSRGTALVETALTIGLALMLVLGAAQMAFIGYTQISADGAAFIATHTAASNPSANGQTTATQVFNQFGASNFSTPAPASTALDQTLVSKTVGGFALVPGVASNYTVVGKDVEAAPANSYASPQPFAFGADAYLHNVCDPNGSCALPTNQSIYLAQSIGTGNGNGANGQFAEWRCHQRVYARLAQQFKWPAGAPGYNSIKKTDLDINNNGGLEATIYGWDTSVNHKC